MIDMMEYSDHPGNRASAMGRKKVIRQFLVL